VETEAQWQYLKDREATQVQGFLFCRPLPIVDLERWHADWLLSRRQRDAGAA
jgi:EAL domain-containing protein (putative c-di-GMP-specific phosphodiesterase class I)